jgi:PAS domain-containing protein
MDTRIKEQFTPIKSYIERSEKEGKTIFCYEVTMIANGGERTELIARTRGTNAFDADMEESLQLAMAGNAELEVTVYGGMSNNASVKNRHHINLFSPMAKLEEKPDLRSIVREEMQNAQAPKQDTTTQGIGSLNLLVDAMSGKADTNEGIAGLFGLASTLAENQSKAEIADLNKKFDLYQEQMKYDSLKEKYDDLRGEYDTLSLSNNGTVEELKKKQEELKQLEERLASYAPNELMKRVGIGVLSNIGGRILGNSPKAADAMGLTPDELKGALGLLDGGEEDQAPVIEAPAVQMSAVEVVNLSPEELEKKHLLDSITQNLNTLSLDRVAKVYEMLQVIMSGEDAFEYIYEMIGNVQHKAKEKANKVMSGAETEEVENEEE